MSRIGNAPILVPKGVEVGIDRQTVTIKGPKGQLTFDVHEQVGTSMADDVIVVKPLNDSKTAASLQGTTRALLNNMILGVTNGFERKLEIVGVGYRAQLQGKKLNLSLGFSHPIELNVPEDVEIETPSQTEIVVRGTDKQRVGQVAANIRAFRKPEPYKGKGVRYADERIVRKEAKKA